MLKKRKKTPKGSSNIFKTKLVPMNKLRDEADDWFSWYVRLRDSALVGDVWTGKCITCNKSGVVAYLDPETAKRRKTGNIRFTSGWDLGHFVGRGNLVTRFDEENCNLQCSFRCNKMNSGEHTKYAIALKDKYGEEVPDKLEKLAQQTTHYKFTRQELEDIISSSKEAIAFYEKEALQNTIEI